MVLCLLPIPGVRAHAIDVDEIGGSLMLSVQSRTLIALADNQHGGERSENS